MRNTLSCFSWCLGALAVPCLISGCVRPQPAAGGSRHFREETAECRYDISYPSLPEPRLEDAARQWIDKERADFDREMPKPRDGHKNEFWITSRAFRSGEDQSLVLQEYRYAQGAHGLTTVKTFTCDGRTGRLCGLFDVLDPARDWYGKLRPFLREKARQMGVTLFLKGEAQDRPLFKSFALEKGDLVLYFDQCTVCPCYAGVAKVPVPLRRIHGILRPAFGGERRRPGP